MNDSEKEQDRIVHLEEISNCAADIINFTMRKSFDKKGANDYEQKIRQKQDLYKVLCQHYVNQILKANLAVKRFENLDDLT